MRRALLPVAIAVLAAAPAVARGAETNQQIVDRATALEQKQDLRAAFIALEALVKPTKAEAAHRSHVGQALLALASADALAKVDQHAAASKGLDAQSAKLDPVDDRFVVAVLAQRSAAETRLADAAAAAGRKNADAEARATIAKAKALSDRHEWEKAATVYASVAKLPATAVSDDVRHSAAVGQLQAERAAADAEPGSVGRFLDSVLSVLRTALKWIVIALPVLLLGALLAMFRRRRHRRPAPGTSIALTDTGASGADVALSREFYDGVQDVRAGAATEATSGIDERRDMDGTAAPVAGLRVASSAPVAVADPAASVTVAGVTINPIWLAEVVRRSFARPKQYELRGALRTDADGAQFDVEQVRTGEEVTVARWSATATGPGARRAVIHEVAAKFAIAAQASYITTSWKSYRAYRDALAALGPAADGGSKTQRLENGEALLERSLESDSFNLMARLRLGLVLRTLGRNREAAAQFDRLLRDTADPSGLPPVAAAFVRRHPEFFYLVAYQGSVAMAKMPPPDRYEARRGLALLVAHLGGVAIPALDDTEREQLERRNAAQHWPDALPDDLERRRLYVLAYAAWGASLLATADRRDRGDARAVEKLRKHRKAVLEELERVRVAIREGNPPEAGEALREAEAALDNAAARILYREGNYLEARRAAARALVIRPDLADAHITLGSIAMAKGNRHGDWDQEARQQLEQALEISPRDPRANYRLGILFADTGRNAEAMEYLKRLPTDPRALDRLGKVLMSESRPTEAAEAFGLALERRPEAGFRARRLVELVIEIGADEHARMRRRTTEQALAAAERLVSACPPPEPGDSPQEAKRKTEARDAAVEMRTKLKQAMEKLDARPAPTPSVSQLAQPELPAAPAAPL